MGVGGGAEAGGTEGSAGVKSSAAGVGGGGGGSEGEGGVEMALGRLGERTAEVVAKLRRSDRFQKQMVREDVAMS